MKRINSILQNNAIRYIIELDDGSFRNCTEAEILEAFRIQVIVNDLRELIKHATLKMDKIFKECKHEVCYDVAGHPYDIRHCVICGHTSII